MSLSLRKAFKAPQSTRTLISGQADFYESDDGDWNHLALVLVKIQKCIYRTCYSYFIRAIDISDGNDTTDMIFEQEIYIPFTTKKRQNHFIYFATADCHIGLSFLEERTAAKFISIIKEINEHEKEQLLSSRNSTNDRFFSNSVKDFNKMGIKSKSVRAIKAAPIVETSENEDQALVKVKKTKRAPRSVPSESQLDDSDLEMPKKRVKKKPPTISNDSEESSTRSSSPAKKSSSKKPTTQTNNRKKKLAIEYKRENSSDNEEDENIPKEKVKASKSVKSSAKSNLSAKQYKKENSSNEEDENLPKEKVKASKSVKSSAKSNLPAKKSKKEESSPVRTASPPPSPPPPPVFMPPPPPSFPTTINKEPSKAPPVRTDLLESIRNSGLNKLKKVDTTQTANTPAKPIAKPATMTDALSNALLNFKLNKKQEPKEKESDNEADDFN